MLTFAWSTLLFYMFADSRTHAKGGGRIFDRTYRSKRTKRKTGHTEATSLTEPEKVSSLFSSMSSTGTIVRYTMKPLLHGTRTRVKRNLLYGRDAAFAARAARQDTISNKVVLVRILYDEQGGNAICTLKNERAHIRRHAKPHGRNITETHNNHGDERGLTAGHTPP